MTSDQLTPDQRVGAEIFFGGYSSWGFGMAVKLVARNLTRIPGTSVGKAASAHRRASNPANGMIGILFTQLLMDSPESPKLYNDFWTLAYAAMGSQSSMVLRRA